MSGKYSVVRSYCSIAQSLIITLGVVGGGIWSYFLFERLHEAERTEAELQRTRVQLQRDLDELHRAFGQVTLTASALAVAGSRTCYLQVVAKVTNVGNRTIRLNFDRNLPLHIARVRVDAPGDQAFEPVLSVPAYAFNPEGDWVGPLPQSSLLPGESGEYPFLVGLPRRGLYLLQFGVPVDTVKVPTSRPDTAAAGFFWSARSYTGACGEPPPTGRPRPASAARTAVSDPPAVE